MGACLILLSLFDAKRERDLCAHCEVSIQAKGEGGAPGVTFLFEPNFLYEP